MPTQIGKFRLTEKRSGNSLSGSSRYRSGAVRLKKVARQGGDAALPGLVLHRSLCNGGQSGKTDTFHIKEPGHSHADRGL